MPQLAASLLLSSDADTARLAQALAPLLGPGDTILLDGGLGAGKTHFARALIQARLAAAGMHEDVPSPTFTLVQTYSDGDCEIWHCDLYRLGDPGEVAELGLEGAFETAICLVEWPDRLGDAAPDDALRLQLAMTDTPGVRRARWSARDPRWQTILSRALAERADA